MKQLWVVDFCPDTGIVPDPCFFPDWEGAGIEVLLADQFTTIVRGELSRIEQAIASYPYQNVTGHPADGRWVAESGDEIYIYDGELLDTEEQLWEAFGLAPEAFGATSWDDVNEDVVRDAIPTY